MSVAYALFCCPSLKCLPRDWSLVQGSCTTPQHCSNFVMENSLGWNQQQEDFTVLEEAKKNLAIEEKRQFLARIAFSSARQDDDEALGTPKA